MMELSPVVVAAGLGLLIAPIGAVVTWVLNREKRESDEEMSSINASNVALDSVLKSLDAVRKDNAKLHEQIVADSIKFDAKIKDLKAQITVLQHIIADK